MRKVGWLLLAAGGVAASASFWIDTRNAAQALDDTTALGYTRSLQHGIGVMMGPVGSILTDWQTMLSSPLGRAVTILAVSALFAGYFFRVAWVIDQDAQESTGASDRAE